MAKKSVIQWKKSPTGGKNIFRAVKQEIQVDPAALERIQQRPKVDLLNDLPTLEEVQTSINKLNLVDMPSILM